MDKTIRSASVLAVVAVTVLAGGLFQGCDPASSPRPDASWLDDPSAHPPVAEGVAALEAAMTREDIDYLVHLDWGAFADGDAMLADPVVWRFLRVLAPVYDRHWPRGAMARRDPLSELLAPVAYANDCEAERRARDAARARLLVALGRIGAGTTLAAAGICLTGLGCTALVVVGGLIVLDAAKDLGVIGVLSAVELFESSCAAEPPEACERRGLSFLTCPDGRSGCGTSCESLDTPDASGASSDASIDADECLVGACTGGPSGCSCSPVRCHGHSYALECPSGSCDCYVDEIVVSSTAVSCSDFAALHEVMRACLTH
ncbi:MAG: hypothetical protein U0353_03585 [Sandaracinus sp.]